MSYDIAFLGGIFPQELEKEVFENSKGNIQNAANVLQWNYIKGLDIVNKTPITIMNSLFIGSYPKYYSKIFIPSFEFSHTENAKDKNIKFINFKYYKNISRRINVYKQLKKWAKQDNKKEKLLFIYSVHSPFLSASKKIKKLFPNIKILVIVPDLPNFMNLSQKTSVIYKILGGLNNRFIEKTIPCFDYYILLTKHMAEKLKIGNNYVVIEGMIDKEEELLSFENKNENYFDIVYTGTLNIKYGIMNIVNAMESIDNKNCRLIICGHGEAKQQIIELSKKDPRIVYKGLLERKEVLQLQKKASLLVNIRPTNEEYTKYSFPSKNMEYIASGTPLLTTNLAGMPEEYKDYVYLIMDENPQSIANSIIKIMGKPKEELHQFGENAKSWIFKEKNNISQVKKIMGILNNGNK